MFIDRTGPSSIYVVIRYVQKSLPVNYSEDIDLVQQNGLLYISVKNRNASIYQASLDANTFYQRSVGWGLLIPLANSPATYFDSTSNEIIIVAQR